LGVGPGAKELEPFERMQQRILAQPAAAAARVVHLYRPL